MALKTEPASRGQWVTFQFWGSREGVDKPGTAAKRTNEPITDSFRLDSGPGSWIPRKGAYSLLDLMTELKMQIGLLEEMHQKLAEIKPCELKDILATRDKAELVCQLGSWIHNFGKIRHWLEIDIERVCS